MFSAESKLSCLGIQLLGKTLVRKSARPFGNDKIASVKIGCIREAAEYGSVEVVCMTVRRFRLIRWSENEVRVMIFYEEVTALCYKVPVLSEIKRIMDIERKGSRLI